MLHSGQIDPQRVVQRNGRVIRLMSDHNDVHLTTMLPEPGALERLIGLEARIQAKIRAAGGVYGRETQVIEVVEGELRQYAARPEDADESLLDEAEDLSSLLPDRPWSITRAPPGSSSRSVRRRCRTRRRVTATGATSSWTGR